nr:lipase secretion chaperone [Variovorax terrae]
MRAGLPAPQAAEALRLLHQYLSYSQAEAQLLSQPRQAEDVASAQDMFARQMALRRAQFGPALAQALFADQEAQTRASLTALATSR